MISTLIINLESDLGRREFQTTQCEKYGLNYKILRAVNKTEISDEYKCMFGQSWVRPLRDAEMACTLSHKNAWETVANSGKPYLICEDDAVFSSDIATILHGLSTVENYDLVQLETFMRPKLIGKTPKATIAGREIHTLYQGFGGAAGYVLWPIGARILLDEFTKRTAPADAFISDIGHISAGQLMPAAIVQLMRAKQAGFHDLPRSRSAISNVDKPKAETSALAFRYRLRRLKIEMYKLRIILKHIGHSKKVFIPFA